MAWTIQFPDGSREVLLHDRNDLEAECAALSRIIQERLGDDAAEMFRAVTTIEEYDDFELACDSYRTLLQDVLDGLRNAAAVLETPRSGRKQVIQELYRLIKIINNEL